MKFKLLLFAFIFHYIILEGQTLQRINGSTIHADSLTIHIQHLMEIANVSGVSISLTGASMRNPKNSGTWRKFSRMAFEIQKSTLFAALRRNLCLN